MTRVYPILLRRIDNFAAFEYRYHWSLINSNLRHNKIVLLRRFKLGFRNYTVRQ